MSWWSHRLTSFHVFSFCIYIVKIFIFWLKHVKACPHIKYITANMFLHLFIRQVLRCHSWNMGFLSFLWTKFMDNYEAMTSSTHSFAYSYRLFGANAVQVLKYFLWFWCRLVEWKLRIYMDTILALAPTVQELLPWKFRTFKIPYILYFLSDLHEIYTVLF